MSIVERNVALVMARADLKGIPRHAVPVGYGIRPYAPGDEQAWLEVQAAADRYNEITLELFRREFGADPALLGRRLFFLVDADGAAIGAAAAWFADEHRGKPVGRVHWVAIRPTNQRRGLAKPLMSHVCVRLRELGHERAFLTTSSARIPAIALYLRFGFVPAIERPEHAAAWTELLRYVPELAQHRLEPPGEAFSPTL